MAELLALVALTCDALGMSEPAGAARRTLARWVDAHDQPSLATFEAALAPLIHGPDDHVDDVAHDLELRTALREIVGVLAGAAA